MGIKAIKKKEMDVIELIANGFVSKEIAEKLGLSVVTVNQRRSRAMHKLAANNSSHLISICYNNNLLMIGK